jgi:hypothetical protein
MKTFVNIINQCNIDRLSEKWMYTRIKYFWFGAKYELSLSIVIKHLYMFECIAVYGLIMSNYIFMYIGCKHKFVYFFIVKHHKPTILIIFLSWHPHYVLLIDSLDFWNHVIAIQFAIQIFYWIKCINSIIQ